MSDVNYIKNEKSKKKNATEFEWLSSSSKLKPTEQKMLNEAFWKLIKSPFQTKETVLFIEKMLRKKTVNVLMKKDRQNVLQAFLTGAGVSENLTSNDFNPETSLNGHQLKAYQLLKKYYNEAYQERLKFVLEKRMVRAVNNFYFPSYLNLLCSMPPMTLGNIWEDLMDKTRTRLEPVFQNRQVRRPVLRVRRKLKQLLLRPKTKNNAR